MVDWELATKRSPIAAIQGFRGLARRQLRNRSLRRLPNAPGKSRRFISTVPDATATLVEDLILTLAEELDAKGDGGSVEDLNDGLDADGVFRKLLTRPRLIVLDEAQRLMDEANTTPKNKQIGRILENLSRASASPGRVALLVEP